MKKTVIITGGAGYIGSVLAQKLIHEKYNVKVIDSLLYGGNSLLPIFEHPNFEFFKKDIRNVNKFQHLFDDTNFVIHLAAIVGEHLCKKIPKESYEINYEATKKIVKICQSKGIRFVFASTCSNYGAIGGNAYASEESHLDPLSLYSTTKINSENLILEENKNNLDGTILRFATVYGLSPRMRFDLLIHELLLDAYINDKIKLYGPRHWRPLIHVQDAANAISLLLKSSKMKSKGVFNVGNTKENYTKMDISNIIKKFISSTKITIEKDVVDSRNYKVNFDKFSKKFGFKTEKTAEKGIKEIFYALNNKIIDYNDPQYSNALLSTNINQLMKKT